MLRLGAIVVLCSVLTATRAPGQVSVARAPVVRFHSWSEPGVSQDSSLSRLLPITIVDTLAERRHKSPVLAWFLSWLVPGGGQGYNGHWGKAAGFFGVAAVGFGLVVANDGFNCSNDCGTRDVGLVVLAASSIGSQIEAPIAASKINREARKASPAAVGLTLARIGF